MINPGKSLPDPTNQTDKKYRILVVDDDEDVRELIAYALIRAGYEVAAAEEGAVAWELLQLNRYDLVVTDDRMPKLTGRQLIEKIRIECLPLPVIMLMGSLPRDNPERTAWLEPNAILLKPFVLAELLETVKGLLTNPVGPGSGPPSLVIERLQPENNPWGEHPIAIGQ